MTSCNARKLRQVLFGKFQTDQEAILRVMEKEMQPHWSQEDPMPVRLARIGLDQATIDWTLWWFAAFDKLARGEQLNTPEPARPPLVDSVRAERQRRMRSDRLSAGMVSSAEFPIDDQDADSASLTFNFNFWSLIWGPDALESECDRKLVVPPFNDKKKELSWHLENLFFGEVTSPSVQYFRRFIDNFPDTVLVDLQELFHNCDPAGRHKVHFSQSAKLLKRIQRSIASQKANRQRRR
jgi:hypothetical protein